MFALVGLGIGLFLYRRGLRNAGRGPAPREARSARQGARPRVLLRRRIRPVRRRSRTRHRLVARPGLRPEDHRRRRQRRRASCSAWFGKGLGKVEDGLVRRYALGILLGTVAVLLFLCCGPGGERGIPDPPRHHRHARDRRGRRHAADPAQPARDRSRPSATSFTAATRARALPAVELQGRNPRLPVRREPAVDPRPRHALHRRRRRHQPVHGRGHRAAVPARPARVRASTSTHRVKAYVAWFLVLEMAIMGIFLSLDLIAFFVFWEFMLVPMYFLILGWGHENRKYAATKFFLYTAAGSALLLASHAGARLPAPGRHRRAHLRLPRSSRRGTACRGPTEVECAVHRVHGRVRDQGAAVPVPHVAPRRAHRGTDRGLGRAGRRDHQDGRVRLRAVLVRAVPAGDASTSRPCCSCSR